MILVCLHLGAILPESFPTYQRLTLCWIFDIDEQIGSAHSFFPNQRLIQRYGLSKVRIRAYFVHGFRGSDGAFRTIGKNPCCPCDPRTEKQFCQATLLPIGFSGMSMIHAGAFCQLAECIKKPCPAVQYGGYAIMLYFCRVNIRNLHHPMIQKG